MKKRALLVPHDLTETADSALKYALYLAPKLEADIHLLHLTKYQKDRLAAKRKLNKIIGAVQKTPSLISIDAHVRTGSIFTEIASFADEIDASFTIMGTHGTKGIRQKLFGSFAVKVITSTRIPFLIVQEGFTALDLSKIVVSLSESQESMQIEQVTTRVAQIFDAKIHLLSEARTDANLKVKTSLYRGLFSNQLKEANVSYVSKALETEKGYAADLINYASENNAHLIAFAYHSDSILPQFDYFAQDIIANKARIPVLVINAKEAGNYFF